VTVPPPEATDARSSGACWWSAASWSSGTKQCWRSRPASRSWTSVGGSGRPGRRCTGGSVATSPGGWRPWRIGRSARRPRRGRCRRRVRPAHLTDQRLHLSLDGVHLKTVPSRQTTVSPSGLRAAGSSCHGSRRTGGRAATSAPPCWHQWAPESGVNRTGVPDPSLPSSATKYTNRPGAATPLCESQAPFRRAPRTGMPAPTDRRERSGGVRTP
jgi:hypothetical protein